MLFMAVFAFALPCFSQHLENFDRWDSLCITHTPYKGNHIDSSHFEFYHSLYKTLTPEESKIPLHRYDSLIHNAKDWQWSDSVFLKCIRCYWYLEQMMYRSFIANNEEKRQAYYELMKDSIFLHLYINGEEIPADFTRAEVYGLYVRDSVSSDFCHVQTNEKGFVHPGNIIEHDAAFFIMKYKGIYYYLGRISPGDIINVYVNDTNSIRLIQTSQRYNSQFHDECVSNIRHYSHRNKKLLKSWQHDSWRNNGFDTYRPMHT